MRLSKLVTILAGALIVAGCGIKGPLFLPEIPAAPAPSPSVTDHNKQDTTD